MRKLFVITLVALVALSMVGCRLVDNDGGGSDIVSATPAVTPTAAVVLTPKVVLPTANVTANISISSLFITMADGTVLGVAGTVINPDGTTTITFKPYTVPTTTTFVGNAGNLTGTLSLGNGQTMALTMPVSNAVSSSAITSAGNTSLITITVSAAGVVTVSITTTTPTGTSTGSAVTTGTTGTVLTQTFYVSAIQYVNGATVATLTTDSAAPVAVATLTPTFVVTFSGAIDAVTATGTLTIKNVTSNGTVTMAKGGFTQTAGASSITYVVGTNADGKKLTNGSTYTVTFNGTVKNAAGTQSVTSEIRTFKVTL